MTPTSILQKRQVEVQSPQLLQSPRFKSLIIRFSADPLPRLFIEEEWNPAAVTLVILFHKLGICLVMPHFDSCNLYLLFRLQPLDERFHLAAVRSLCSGELQQIKFLFGHCLSSSHGLVTIVEGSFFFGGKSVLPISLATGAYNTSKITNGSKDGTRASDLKPTMK